MGSVSIAMADGSESRPYLAWRRGALAAFHPFHFISP